MPESSALPAVESPTNLQSAGERPAPAKPAETANAADALGSALSKDHIKEASARFLENVAKAPDAPIKALADGTATPTPKPPKAKAEKGEKPKVAAKVAEDEEESPYADEGEGNEEGITDDEGTGDEGADEEQEGDQHAETDEGEEGAAAEGEEGTDEDEDAKATVVVLRGLPERGEADIELDVQDPAIADRLRRMENDGLRGKDYREKVAKLAEKESAFEEITIVAQTNPVGFALEIIPKDQQVAVAKALLTEHWDALQPEVASFFEDPASIAKAQTAALRQARDDDKQTERARETTRRATAIRGAVFDLIPEGVAADVQAQFIADAERDIIAEINAGRAVAPEGVPALLQRRITMYGFAGKDAGKAGPKGSKSVPAVAVARPLSERATAIARRADVEKSQTRRRTVQAQRKNAQAIPPGGRGTAAARKPLVPSGASIEDATKAVVRSGATTWDGFRPK